MVNLKNVYTHLVQYKTMYDEQYTNSSMYCTRELKGLNLLSTIRGHVRLDEYIITIICDFVFGVLLARRENFV